MSDERGSMYDFAGPDYVAPVQSPVINRPAPVQMESSGPVETPHANRSNLSNPYAGTFAQKVKEATTDSAPKTSAAYEWALLIANRTSSNHIAVKVNGSFVRNKINGENFANEKARYFNLYNKELSE